MDFQFDNLIFGFSLALTWQNLLFCFLGCLLGTLIGVLPGIGPLATISMLLSITVYFPPLTSLIMLSGIYYGAQYGGSTTAILCRIPGESSSIITCLDGYEMAKQGRGGAALATAALASLFAGIVGTLVITMFSPVLAKVAVSFNAPEYFALMLLGLISVVVFSQGSLLNALAMACVGVMLGLVGSDIETGTSRFTFGVTELSEGLNLVAVGMGLFGLGEIISNLSRHHRGEDIAVIETVDRLWLTGDEFKQAAPAAVRGTAIGSTLGLLPGGGVLLSTFAAYILEKKVSRTPERFGKGAIQGVASPEAANNAAAQTSFIPLLTLGIPSTPTIALLLGAMLIQGVQPGPQILTEKPDLFWGLVASMFIGNAMLVIINLPMIGLWVRLLKIPYAILFPAILIFCCIGTLSLSNSMTDLVVMSGFAFLGIFLMAFGLQPVPMLLGFILGPLAEENLRRALVISDGSFVSLLYRPITLGLILLTVVMLLSVLIPAIRQQKDAQDSD
ncbi:tripartite tricarboxylate transporter permease [Bosea sp. NBC_00550]|uniref:tripartite tricarboxylate transporter permease n=1 Tax=Bosea sp. NBC_00550 TaxID=2969621 RepID=UPI002232261D|nr:tripartite tricarboxylate transporter permease [Bosea sp. NBC_00550]UZF94920.1 tripartite tricarboxylate transporter permease [Bosea sp. NBC_00550]